MSGLGVATPAWHEANQQHICAALRLVRRRLEALGPGAAVESQPGDDSPPAANVEAPMALDHVAAAFGLSPFERDLLVLCAGMELDGTFPALCASANHDARRPFPTFGLALAALQDAHWSALAPHAPLRLWRLIEVAGGDGLTANQLRIDERILHFLAGIDGIDERLAALVQPAPPPGHIVRSHATIAATVVRTWVRTAGDTAATVVQLCGDAPAARRAIAAEACRTAGLRLWVMSAMALAAAPVETEGIARLWSREMRLSNHALLIECDDADSPDGGRGDALARFSARVRGRMLIGTRDPRRLPNVQAIALDVAKPSAAEQASVWRRALGDAGATLNGHVDRLVSQFSLGVASIVEASATALAGADDGADAPLERGLWDACRIQARPKLDDLAQRLDSHADWSDLVLPEGPRQLLRDLSTHVRHRATVYETWGFAKAGGRGLGVSALFSGASGTGKTMAAEVLAGDLQLDLYRVDLSSVVSKYIGETEKNLRRIFDAAEDGGAILLFDEADALFGKRSEVKDSHDRFANIEVSYLLQRIESYRGLAILTTNQRHAIDVAFLRRIRFIVHFPFPDAAERAEIWRRVFPPAVPLGRLALERLAQLNVSGGNIRNIALGAAFFAAEAGDALGMADVLRAARVEYAKIERPLTDAEIAGWSGADDESVHSALRDVAASTMVTR